MTSDYYNLLGKSFRSVELGDFLLRIVRDEDGRMQAVYCVREQTLEAVLDITDSWRGETLPGSWTKCGTVDETFAMDVGL